MEDVSLAEAKERLEELLARAANGEDVVIQAPNLGAIRLTPTSAPSRDFRYPPRIPGLLKGKVRISDEALLAPLTEEELDWHSGKSST